MKRNLLLLSILSLLTTTSFGAGIAREEIPERLKIAVEGVDSIFVTLAVYPTLDTSIPECRFSDGAWSVPVPDRDSSYMVLLSYLQDGKRVEHLNLLLGPGDVLTLTGRVTPAGVLDYEVSGSALYDAETKLRKEHYWREDLYCRLCRNNPKAEGLPRDSVQIFDQRIKTFQKEYVKAHPAALVSAYFLLEDPEEMLEQYDLLDDRVKYGPYGDALMFHYRDIRRRLRLDELKNGAVPMKDFTLPDAQEQPFTLSSVKGKYVMLDFWGTWCGFCVREIPRLKEYYAKYRDRLEIVGVACRESRASWLAARDRLALPWISLIDEQGEVMDMYGVSTFPTHVVINPKGVVERVIVGADPELFPYLDKLLKQ